MQKLHRKGLLVCFTLVFASWRGAEFQVSTLSQGESGIILLQGFNFGASILSKTVVAKEEVFVPVYSKWSYFIKTRFEQPADRCSVWEQVGG